MCCCDNNEENSQDEPMRSLTVAVLDYKWQSPAKGVSLYLRRYTV